MGSFAAYGIPVPDVAPYNDSSKAVSRGQGEQALHGFATIDFLWGRLTREQAWRVRKFIDDAKSGTGWLYLTVDLNDDSSIGPQWADIRAKPHRDPKQADSGPIIGRIGQGSHENYSMFLNNVVILNNPSNYTDA
jgi:hypothetical protein